MNNDNQNQNILLSFIIGAAAGITAGLLLAPETGEETRKTITKKATDLKDKATKTATDLKGKANNLKEQVGSQLNTTMGKVNETIGKFKKGESKPDSPAATTIQGNKKTKKPGNGTGAGPTSGTGTTPGTF